MNDNIQNTDVPCNGCRVCCKNQAIMLHPEKGDVEIGYKTVEIVNPMTGMPALMLDHKENGDCVYLGENGCEIYERRPVICQKYDCRKLYVTLTRAQREHLKQSNQYSSAEEEEAKKRIHTLSFDEKQRCITKRKSGGRVVIE